MSELVINRFAGNHTKAFRRSFIFTSRFPKWAYEKAGFTCRHRFFRKDSFILNGRKCTRTEADRLMGMMGWTIHESLLIGKNDLIIRKTKIYHNGKPVER